MDGYYAGRRASVYNRRWRTFTKRTLTEAMAVIDVEAYGVDASADMLAQASLALHNQPRVHVEPGEIGPGETAGLPYAPHTFDLITCTNVLHDIREPGETLAGLRRLLSSGSQLVLEDFARREEPFPWKAFEWLVRWIEGRNVHVYFLDEARSLCLQAGFRVLYEKSFVINWLWHRWVLSIAAPM